ncbi:MAG: aldo/keto reductase [Candidatus Neomarinimicrobiota bacterium]|jgi:predicted aldo/keto reductase-like oxidoreductase
MNYRNFGKTGVKVPALGMGCMRLPVIDGDATNIDENAAIKLIRQAIDGGISYVDTAWGYHGGNAEPLVAKALADGYREKVLLATKLPCWLVKKPADMDKYLNTQLEKLQTDHLDLYLLHALNAKSWENMKANGVFEFLEKIKKDGRAKLIGFSFHDKYEVFEDIIRSFDWDFCQIQYNILDENYQAGLKGLKLAASKGMGLIIMEPLRGGGLTNNIPKNIQQEWDKLQPKRTPADWSLSWLWDQEEVGLILSGMSEPWHVSENIAAASRSGINTLTEDEKTQLQKIRDMYHERITVNCTQCSYCMPCPHGVDIPNVFRFLIQGSMMNDWNEAQRLYNIIVPDDKKASNCISCGICLNKCPQQIQIPEKMKVALEKFGK